jgi:hypothetical protein
MERSVSSPDAPAGAIPVAAARPTGWRRGLGALWYAARVALAVGALLVWTIQGLLPAWQTWQAAARTPSAAGVSYDAQRLTLDGNTLYPLLAAARTACPAPRPVLALSDDVRAYQQGNYFLYPRRVDVIGQADSFSAAALTAHAGGCVFTYGPSGGRLDPYRAQLTEVTCTPDGCLYRIK